MAFRADGYTCTTAMVYDVRLKAAAEGISIEAACADLDDVVDGNTNRGRLTEQLHSEQIRHHEQARNKALSFALPPPLQTKGLEGAIDFHDEPFYGTDAGLQAVVCRDRAPQGTPRFVRTASAYGVYRQLRLTLAVTLRVAGR